MKEILITIVSFIASLFFVILFIAFGANNQEPEEYEPPSPEVAQSLQPAGLNYHQPISDQDFKSWYIVWTLFLRRFKFVRELLGTTESETDVSSEKPRRTRGKTRRD